MKKKDLLRRIENLETRLFMLEARSYTITYTDATPSTSPYFVPNTCSACINGGVCNCILSSMTVTC